MAVARGRLDGTANLKGRKTKDKLFAVVCFLASAFSVLLLALLIGKLVLDGIAKVNWQFLSSMPSAMFPEEAGILPALIGSLVIMILTILITVPVGVLAAIYLEEFQTKRNRVTEFIQVNIANLSGVPSIVYGMLGLFLFVTLMALGKTMIAGALTMSLLILPLVILVSQESLKAVPRYYREASLALGATQWQTIVKSVLPSALPGILTGVILAAGRAIGETAPLIVVGAMAAVNFIPTKFSDKYMVLPITIFDWIQQPQVAFRPAAAGAIVVLLIMLLTLNSAAIIIRARTQKKI